MFAFSPGNPSQENRREFASESLPKFTIGKGAGDGKRYREFVRPAGEGLVTGDYR